MCERNLTSEGPQVVITDGMMDCGIWCAESTPTLDAPPVLTPYSSGMSDLGGSTLHSKLHCGHLIRVRIQISVRPPMAVPFHEPDRMV